MIREREPWHFYYRLALYHGASCSCMACRFFWWHVVHYNWLARTDYMQRRTADGGITTTDEQITHTVWPCVPHRPDVPCLQAQSEFRRYGTRTLKPQPRKAPPDAKSSR